MKRSILTAGALIGTLGLVLAACSPSADDGDSGDGDTTATTDTTDDGDKVTVTFRLWDDTAEPAYAESFAEFEAQNSDIKVEIELVPWGDYWDQLPLDVSSGDMADIYWVNSSNFALYADNGNLIMVITEFFGDVN